VKLVVPFTPGGGIDGIGRILGARLSEMWGQQMVIENKPARAATSPRNSSPALPLTATPCTSAQPDWRQSLPFRLDQLRPAC